VANKHIFVKHFLDLMRSMTSAQCQQTAVDWYNKGLALYKSAWKREGMNQACTKEDIYNCYRLLLGRDIAPVEWPLHQAEVGQPLKSVVSSYLGSVEFMTRGFGSSKITLTDLPDFKIYVDDFPPIGGAIQNNKTYEPHVTKIMKSILKQGMTFLDVGANIGYYSLLAAGMLGPSGKVISVEPNVQNVKLLYLSSIINEFDNIEIYPFAASNCRGLISYSHDMSNGSIFSANDPNVVFGADLVFSEKLDNLVDRVDVIKIDVEGADYLALKGGRHLLESRPTIFAEFSPLALQSVSGVTGKDYLELLIDAGYEITVIMLDESVIECEKDIDKIIKICKDAKSGYIDIFAS